jgi:kynurenine formamidase
VDPEGSTSDAITPEMTVGEAAILDLMDIPANQPISAERMARAAAHVRKGDIVITKTGWGSRVSLETPEFWATAPWMTAEASILLREKGIKAIGFDFPQDECIRYFISKQQRPPLPEHVTHFHLLKQGVIMFEYLTNTAALTQPRSFVVALPVKLPDSDGAPARVIAIEGDAP